MIDPSFLDELARFDPSFDQATEDRQPGEQQSPSRGEGLTFSDHRSYTFGDDTRRVDWKLFARSNELYVKQFEEERNLTVHVLLDGSESMAFGEGDHNKFEYAAKLGLGFCALTAEENNSFRCTVFDRTPKRLDRDVSTQGEVFRLLERLNDYAPAGRTDLQQSLEQYAATIDSRSLVLVASDFLADVEDLEVGLAAFGDSDVILAHVVAPGERDLPAEGDTVFADSERDVQVRTYFGNRARATYSEQFEAHVSAVRRAADRAHVSHVRVDTDKPFFDAFTHLWLS